ncbi:hypothetical protein L7F22_053910 [Adiantum nelumboides]|nr:hypothetical protein [Adiantum nelumboides]
MSNPESSKNDNIPQKVNEDDQSIGDTSGTPQIFVQDEPEEYSSPSSSPMTTMDQHSSSKESKTSQSRQFSSASIISSNPISSTPTSPLFTSGGGSSSDTTNGKSRIGTRQMSSSSRKSGGLNSHRNSSFEYKETLDATTRHLEDGSRIINQYKLGKMIGKGAYGSVYRANLLDDPDSLFAIKEFGKTRLRKRRRAENFRRPPPGRGRGRGRAGAPMRGGRPIAEEGPQEAHGGHLGDDEDMNSATKGLNAIKLGAEVKNDSGKGNEFNIQSHGGNPEDPLSLIRREIAILKKLHHPHLVHLYEVLDDPTKDELYMVFEYCADGAVIDIKLHEQVEPLGEDIARDYFVQIMLGVEYLHHHDIVHRDLKPDNILLQNDRTTCKIVDFGVSEFFIKPGDDTMQKSAGSPAFMSPELCKAGHGDFHGKDSDLWSLGVTFYCMVVGHLPFDKSQFLELYESIQSDAPRFPSHLSANCKDLLNKMLNKDPSKRMTIQQMREHPFITKDGKEDVISMEENIRDLVEEVTAEELDSAINRIASVFTLARAISKFKRAGSRASSAGSLADVTSSILSKGKEVGNQGSAAVKEWSKGAIGESREGSEDQSSDQSRSESQSEQPSLEHIAEAHVVMGTSNRQWAAEHIARAITRVSGHSHRKHKKEEQEESDKKTNSNSKQEEEEADVETEKDGKDSDTSTKMPERREEVLHFSPSDLNTNEKVGEDYFDSRGKGKEDSDPLSGMHEHKPKHQNKDEKPKLLPEQPVVESPATDDIPTPKGAASAYIGKR